MCAVSQLGRYWDEKLSIIECPNTKMRVVSDFSFSIGGYWDLAPARINENYTDSNLLHYPIGHV